MKRIFAFTTFALSVASMSAAAVDFTIDFEHTRAFRQASTVRGTKFRLNEIGAEQGHGGLTLGVVDRPNSVNVLDRAVQTSEIAEKYGAVAGRFLRIDGSVKSRDVQLSFDKPSQLVSFDYVLSNSVARTDAFDYTFTCIYSAGKSDRFAVTVANSANLVERTRGRIECAAPENAYVRSIVFSNATNGSYETWIDNIVGEEAVGKPHPGYLARRYH